MSEEERFEIEIRETREIVRRMDRQIELVERLLAESEASIRVVRGDLTIGIGMERVWCPPGTFWMGSPEDEVERYEDENENETRHQVTLTRGFWIGRYPVTQGQWEEVMGGNPSYFQESGQNAPVERVNWDDAQEFCRALGQRDGREYRLPTEAEWEYACRAGSTGAWCFGDEEEKLGDYAWYDVNSDGRTHPVGQKKPNSWGIHDMHGNLWEWCQDCYGDYPRDPTTDPLGPENPHIGVGRGGCFHNPADDCRSARRAWFFQRAFPKLRPVNHRSDGGGFRVAVSSTP
jgi:formylglycine-generating enzyme required for sulfatase activity